MILINDGTTQYYLYGSMVDNTTRSNTLTSYPTVEGTSFSDHYYREPESVSFRLNSSEVSRSMIYMVGVDSAGARVEELLNVERIIELVESWFKNATRLEITTLRYSFRNMVLQSYSWSDGDLAVFNPQLTFREARVQSMRTGIINNPDQYYEALYGVTVSVGGATAVETAPNLGDAIVSAGVGVAAGAAIGSVIPGLGTAAGAVIGGVVGFFGSLFS